MHPNPSKIAHTPFPRGDIVADSAIISDYDRNPDYDFIYDPAMIYDSGIISGSAAIPDSAVNSDSAVIYDSAAVFNPCISSQHQIMAPSVYTVSTREPQIIHFNHNKNYCDNQQGFITIRTTELCGEIELKCTWDFDVSMRKNIRNDYNLCINF